MFDKRFRFLIIGMLIGLFIGIIISVLASIYFPEILKVGVQYNSLIRKTTGIPDYSNGSVLDGGTTIIGFCAILGFLFGFVAFKILGKEKVD
jgi:hypothetical protein